MPGPASTGGGNSGRPSDLMWLSRSVSLSGCVMLPRYW